MSPANKGPSRLYHLTSRFCEMIFLWTKMWCKAKQLTQSRSSIILLSCLVKENRLHLVILITGIEEKDIIQISCFIQDTNSYNDLDHIWHSSCDRSSHLIKLWKIHFYPLKLSLPTKHKWESSEDH